MSWSLKIGRVAGIPIFVHWTFLILLAFYGYRGWRATGEAAGALTEVVFILALFGCVILHELGHALAARRYGVPTADITLLPIGGVARLQRMPDHPAEELVVALAGPAVNVIIAGVLLLLGYRATDPLVMGGSILPRLLWVNIGLVIFNLLPAFPMDGGRVLRALLALAMDYGQATRIAASVGQFMAMVFGFLGLIGNPMLLLIALFVWIGAEAEASQVQERMFLRDVPVRQAMLTEYHALAPTDPLRHATRLLLAGAQQDFPVRSDGRIVGVLTRADLMSGLAEAGPDAPVADFATSVIGTVEADAMLGPAVLQLREQGSPCLQVLDRGQPVGLLTLENVGEYLMVRAALAGQRAVREPLGEAGQE